ncbi:MAG: hypothetical protein Ct9H300mP8_08090 [Gammaproteobacteria bacterium]|nr:MAG: hypothetical protein Ct9H300mP8_08090 [Gammaproteobacteria bacterium]
MHRIEVDWSEKVDLLVLGKGREVALEKARKEFEKVLWR